MPRARRAVARHRPSAPNLCWCRFSKGGARTPTGAQVAPPVPLRPGLRALSRVWIRRGLGRPAHRTRRRPRGPSGNHERSSPWCTTDKPPAAWGSGHSRSRRPGDVASRIATCCRQYRRREPEAGLGRGEKNAGTLKGEQRTFPLRLPPKLPALHIVRVFRGR